MGWDLDDMLMWMPVMQAVLRPLSLLRVPSAASHTQIFPFILHSHYLSLSVTISHLLGLHLVSTNIMQNNQYLQHHYQVVP